MTLRASWLPAVLLALVLSAQISAQSGSGTSSSNPSVFQEGALDLVVGVIERNTDTWYPTIKVYARKLLFTLAGISLVWMGFQLALKRTDFMDVIREFVLLVLTVGFYWVLIENIDTWSETIWQSFGVIAADLVPDDNTLKQGDEIKLTPSTVVNQGLYLYQTMKISAPTFDITTGVLMAISGLFAVILFILMAAHMVVVLVEGYIVIAAGVIFLGFGGSEWTIDSAKNYLRFILGFGTKLFSTYIVMALGITLIEVEVINRLEAANQAASIAVYGAEVGKAIFFAFTIPLVVLMVANMIPAVFVQIVGGIGNASNFALGSMLTAGLMTAASVAKQGLLGGAVLGTGAVQQGLAAMNAFQGTGVGGPLSKLNAFASGFGLGLSDGAKSAVTGALGGAGQNAGLGDPNSAIGGMAQQFWSDKFTPPKSGSGGSVGGSGGGG